MQTKDPQARKKERKKNQKEIPEDVSADNSDVTPVLVQRNCKTLGKKRDIPKCVPHLMLFLYLIIINYRCTILHNHVCK